jgi:uncharacterized protein YjbI with pentapeptide repeats
MKAILFSIATILASLSLSVSASAEDFEQLRQLLSTKQCPLCDLTGSGLVMSNLVGAQLKGANLSRANLSQANLSGANLSWTNLSGTSLNGANLTGADLTGAILNGTDLRGAYLSNANLAGVKLDAAYVQGAVGIPSTAGTPELFYGWGLLDARRGGYVAAIENYNKALSLNQEYAPVYLARAVVYYNLGNQGAAAQDAAIASQLFQKQNNQNGYQTAQNFIQAMEAIKKANNPEQAPAYGNIVQGILPILLQVFLAL